MSLSQVTATDFFKSAYSFAISSKSDKVRISMYNDMSSSKIDELIEKANKIIDWKIKRYYNISTAI